MKWLYVFYCQKEVKLLQTVAVLPWGHIYLATNLGNWPCMKCKRQFKLLPELGVPYTIHLCFSGKIHRSYFENSLLCFIFTAYNSLYGN